MTDLDISHVLDDWVYEPGKAMVRKIIGKHDRELIQMRIDLGVLQMHAVGRPDGQRPHDMESLLDFHIEKLESHINEFDGDDSKYKLSEEECVALQQEAIQYHHRYICFFQLEAYEDVIQDADRNLDAIELVEGGALIALEPHRLARHAAHHLPAEQVAQVARVHVRH